MFPGQAGDLPSDLRLTPLKMLVRGRGGKQKLHAEYTSLFSLTVPRRTLVGEVGFEPTKYKTGDLQSAATRHRCRSPETC